MNGNLHITADVPVDLVRQVDDRVDELGVTRSFAIRKGLSLFLQTFRQFPTISVNPSDNSQSTTEQPEAANERQTTS